VKFQKEPETFKSIYKKKDDSSKGYWFLRHEKLFHFRTKKTPLAAPFIKRRVRSAKKKNKSLVFGDLEVAETRELKRKLKAIKKQRSIFDAARKYGKKSLNSKASESTA